MALCFPNPTRSYDADRHRVRFWAHDSSMEIPFFVEAGALLRLNPGCAGDETAMLATFDANRERINVAASKIHSRERQNFHVLDAADFQ